MLLAFQSPGQGSTLRPSPHTSLPPQSPLIVDAWLRICAAKVLKKFTFFFIVHKGKEFDLQNPSIIPAIFSEDLGLCGQRLLVDNYTQSGISWAK